MRFFYTFFQWWKYQSKLKTIVTDPAQQIDSVLTLKASMLKAQGIHYVVLDVDGVLTAHAQTELSPEIADWLHCINQALDGRLFILTNNPYSHRLTYLQETFPFLTIIRATRKKPYPEGLLAVITEMKCRADQVVMVDDRLATGCLAACIAGVQIRWVTEPMVDFKRHYWKELFFAMLRKLDRLLIIK